MDVRVAAYAVIVRDGAILLSHWNEHGHSGWSLPGGGVEDYEQVPAGAIREVFEETGYHAELGPVLGINSYWVDAADRLRQSDQPLHALRIIYTATITGGELRHEIGGSSDEARWVALDEVADLHTVSLVDIALEMWREANPA